MHLAQLRPDGTIADWLAHQQGNAVPVRRDVLESSSIRRPLICIAGAALLAVAGCTGSAKVGPDAVASLTPDGTVEMREVQVAYIGSGGGGNGTLYYRGQAYPFPAYQPRDPTQVA